MILCFLGELETEKRKLELTKHFRSLNSASRLKSRAIKYNQIFRQILLIKIYTHMYDLNFNWNT